MSLRWKLTALMTAVMVVSTVLVGTISYQSVQSRLMTEIDRSLVEATNRFFDRPNASVRFGPRGRVVVTVPERPLGIEQFVVQVADGQGQILAASENVTLPVFKLDQWSSTDQAVIQNLQSSQGELYRVRAVIVELGPSTVAIVQLGRDLAETTNILDDLQLRILTIGASIALLAAIAGWVIATGMTSRLRRLSGVAEEIASTTRLDFDVPIDGSDEVGRLGRSFRGMLQALARSKEQQQQLVQDAGHELRTPLTSLRMNVDVLRRHGDLTDEMRLQVLDDLNRDVEDLAQLVEEVLSLAVDPMTNPMSSSSEPVDLAVLLSDLVDRTQRRSGRTINFSFIHNDRDSQPHPIVMGQRVLIERAVANLLDNALKFDAGASPIDVSLKVTAEAGRDAGLHKGPDVGVITVRDRGLGIPPDELEAVFQRFHRSVKARALPGSGLGLAIVAEIARLHQGSYFARNHPDGGAEVGISFPLASS